MLCSECANFEEHCTCFSEGLAFDWGGEIAAHMNVKTPPPCPKDCICENCIEEAMNQALIGMGNGVLPGDSLTEHLPKACECGAAKVGSGAHSHWCPAFGGI